MVKLQVEKQNTCGLGLPFTFTSHIQKLQQRTKVMARESGIRVATVACLRFSKQKAN
jgi:hypothetical protein